MNMNKWFNKTLVAALGLLFFASCEKDETKTLLALGDVPALTSSASTLVLVQADGAKEAVTFTWTAMDYGFQAAPQYTLQMTPKGGNFVTAVSTEVTLPNTAFTKKFTVSEFNKEVLKIIPASLASDIEVRVKSEIAGVENQYSNVVAMKVTPYRDIINYPSLWVAGNHQGWDPKTAPKISSKSNDKIYEGYVNFGNAGPEFKLVKGNDWSFGDYGSAGGNKLGNGGPNLTLTSTGYYRVIADINKMEWSNLKIDSWGVIGSATPGGWDSDTNMTYDAATGLWTARMNLVGGQEMKFRANDGWDVNFGDNKADGVPDYGGDNIKIKDSGNYTITLDLSVGGNYSYTLKKN
jgi:starch-binding outer membrane protein SusE/F